MEVTEGQSHLCCEESHMFFGESFDLDEVAEKLTTLNEFHEEVDALLVLEHELHVHEEWVVNRVEDIFLKADVLELLMFNDNVLTDALHGIEVSVSFVLDEEHLTEGTLANHLFDFEVFELGFLLVSSHIFHVSFALHLLLNLNVVFIRLNVVGAARILITRIIVLPCPLHISGRLLVFKLPFFFLFSR